MEKPGIFWLFANNKWRCLLSSGIGTMHSTLKEKMELLATMPLQHNPADYLSPQSIGSFGWGGAFNTHGWADPKEGIIALLFTQEYLSPYYSIGEEFQVAVYQALED